MSRGVIYIYWGNKLEAELQESLKSVSKYGYDYRVFKLDESSHFGHKSTMYDLSPFDTTLFLDTDTILLDNIDFGFEMAEKHGIAMTIAPGCYARRFIPELTDHIEYNTGAMFFSKNDVVKKVYNTWKSHSDEFPRSDQSSFTRAVYEHDFNVSVLPQNYNYRAGLNESQFFGPLKIWHSRLPLPINIHEWNARETLKFGYLHIGYRKGHTSIINSPNQPIMDFLVRFKQFLKSRANILK